MKRLQTLTLKDKYFVGIESEIMRIFRESIYSPIMQALDSKVSELENAKDPLVEAMKNGVVWFRDGYFYGQFNAKISRRLKEIGARYKNNRWKLEGALPPDLSFAQIKAERRYKKLVQSVVKTLDTLGIESIDLVSKLKDKYNQSIKWMNDDFKLAVKAVTIPPKLTDAQQNILSTEWSTNLSKYIKGWTQDNIFKLRQEIEGNSFSGHRAADLIAHIQQNYGVSQRKAAFLARQETKLLMSKFHEARYRSIGSTKYIWSTSNDERVRLDHKLLNNKIFSWDDPPIIDQETGARGNPGEYFGCRCVAIALFE